LRKRHRAPHVATTATVFAALGDETRLKLISRLIDAGPQSIATLADGFDMSRQAISKHLRVISSAGLAKSESRGRQTVWQLESDALDEARRYLDLISKDWDDKLRRLKEFVESD
jgi:DNA-binding transcriptional ArsR family regulator